MITENKDAAIIVFARFPVEGKVKTRLARETNNEFATSFYKICADHTFSELLKSKKKSVDVYLFCSEKSEMSKIISWTDNKFVYQAQQGDNLGLRMFNAFTFVFNEGYKKVIIIGTDAPDLSSTIVQNAINILTEKHCVIGPANDGGYYLLGFRSSVINVFRGIEWSTQSVFENTIEKLKLSKTNFFVLDELIDIDTKEDLTKWINHLKDDSYHPVKTFIDSKAEFFK
jgi:uncharacterized protein